MSEMKRAFELQQVVDQSNPELVEVLEQKNDEELIEIFNRFQDIYDVATKGNNEDVKRLTRINLKTVSSYIELKRIMKNLKREDKSSERDYGGFSIT